MTEESGIDMEDVFYRDVDWSLQFAWLPHLCDKTGREIWFEWAYRGISKSLVSKGKLVYSRWIDRDTWMIEKLKGTI